MITTTQRSLLMSRIRRTGTSSELIVRKLARSCGLRFGTNARGLPGTPDLVNRRRKWVIFVHGCFWHAHRECSLSKLPKTNSDFWCDKFLKNRIRDQRKANEIRKMGYRVLIVWQCELRDEKALKQRIAKLLHGSSQ
jgi:DNA mismatch endonuclease (patch repair protein)